MTERPIKPLPDGRLVLFFKETPPSIPMVIPFKDIIEYRVEDFGVMFRTEQGRTFFPWHRLYKVREDFNTDKYVELIQQWAELDHPHHTEEAPEKDCGMCRETQFSNAAGRFFNGGTL